MPRLHKILIANRAEIACRVIRSAQALGYRAVAVFSDADRDAPHVQLADEAVCIGPGPAAESYLSIERILEACKRTGADALHPGYGFLSENPALVEACAAASVTFIGPSANAMRLMGDKALAKQRMIDAGVPTAAAYLGSDQSLTKLAAEAERIGYPLLIKATAGGGGRGIRVVRSSAELEDAVLGAQQEAQSAFGDAKLLLERFIERGRHVEVQVFADAHGNAIYLGDRDCTTQRRRQKVIEEAPAPGLSDALRAAMGTSAVQAALSIGYAGAGTVEFMLDSEHNYHFLEMNTRLQVEHPVTELVTRLDLVALQIRIAEGQPLPLAQADVQLRGHAIEARLYAEDAYAGFRPQTGRITHFFSDHALQQPDVRIDSGIQPGSVVTPYYDAMLAKVMAYGTTRTEAIRKLLRALEDAPLFGLTTNARFLLDLLRTQEFAQSQLHTATLDHWTEQNAPLCQRPAVPETAWALACAVLLEGSGDAFRSAGESSFALTLAYRSERRSLRVTQHRDGLDVGPVQLRAWSRSGFRCAVTIDGIRKHYIALRHDGRALIAIDGQCLELSEPALLEPKTKPLDPSQIVAPLAGRIARILVQPGAAVELDDTLCIVEAMKMETRVNAAASGEVRELYVQPGDQVSAGQLLVGIDLVKESSS
ncbi:MAG TPA: biotin carboxylase N-terminal domain-containing protein [Polyangiales bacterium]|nr:biotin carboxylase N-terminal domain-containing protein [Polyangiales bacterium]